MDAKPCFTFYKSIQLPTKDVDNFNTCKAPDVKWEKVLPVFTLL